MAPSTSVVRGSARLGEAWDQPIHPRGKTMTEDQAALDALKWRLLQAEQLLKEADFVEGEDWNWTPLPTSSPR